MRIKFSQMKHTILIILTTFTLCFSQIKAQNTQGGLKGMVAVPIADLVADRTIDLGIQTNPGSYKFITNSNRKPPYNNELIYFANIGFIPRMNILAALVRDIDVSDTIRQGVGDRSIQASFQILKRTKNRPSLVLNLADAIFSTNQYQTTNHIVATHQIEIKNNLILITAGYGIPYYVRWTKRQTERKLIKTQNDFLTSFFGGIIYQPSDRLELCSEYDGQKLNLGCSIDLIEKLTFDLNIIACKYPTFGISYNAPLK